VTDKDTHPWSHLNIEKVEILPLLDGFASGVQAKLGRSFLTSQLEDEESLFTLMDVDQFLINFDWLNSCIKEDYLIDNDLIAIGANGYIGRPDGIDGKFPMYFTTAYPQGFRKLFGINKGISFDDFINKFSSINNPRDGHESTKHMFNMFSDESLFAWLIRENKIKCKHIDHPDFVLQRSLRRIDRTASIMAQMGIPNFNHDFWFQEKLTHEQKQMILDGFFIDVFPARPYEDHKYIIDDIVRTIIEKERNNVD
jgi:hypothetical protein